MIDPDGYRPNVGIIRMRDDRRLFWARRVHRDRWQFPQGGMNSDETPLEAMYRELQDGDRAVSPECRSPVLHARMAPISPILPAELMSAAAEQMDGHVRVPAAAMGG